MLKRILIRNIRQPLLALAAILFATALTVVLCHLHQAGEEEKRSFDQAYASVPVFFKVTDLDGTKPKDYTGINGWVVDLFTKDGLQPNLSPFVGELHVRVTYFGETKRIFQRYDETLGAYAEEFETVTVTGVTSTRVAEELTEGWGGHIEWLEGYDESILASNELVCIVPQKYQDLAEVTLKFKYVPPSDGEPVPRYVTEVFKVVGVYTDPGNTRIYIPYPTVEWVHARQGKSKTIENIGAILNDNTQLAQLKESAAQWFAEPNPTGEKTEWGRFGYEYYFYALDIDDSMLHNLESNMRNSMRLNALASAVVFALSAGAGFLTGFLVIRSRKREIALMRTMGTSQVSIYLELALEQLVCIAAGILVGGGYSLWQPVGRLAIFGGIYYLGLTAALIIFLRKNLLTTIKEDE